MTSLSWPERVLACDKRDPLRRIILTLDGIVIGVVYWRHLRGVVDWVGIERG